MTPHVRPFMLAGGAIALGLALSSSAGWPKDKDDKRSALFEDVTECRATTDQTARLACYDRTVAALDDAEKTKQIVVMDKAQVHETQRSLFGFSIPKIRLFGGGDDDAVSSIDAVVASTARDQDNRLLFTVEDGGHWRQIDDRPAFRIRRGTKVTIKRASLGSYFANFQGSTAIRVKREQ